MYTFDCLLASPDAAWYAQGTFKSPRGAQVDAVAQRFVNGTEWKMSKVAFDQKMKSQYIHAPMKCVVHTCVRACGDEAHWLWQ